MISSLQRLCLALACTATYAAASSTTTALTTSPPGSTGFGASVTLTAVISSPAATGKVAFYDGSSFLGTASISSGAAKLVTSLLPTGKRSLHAYYTGDAAHDPSASTVVNLSVQSVSGFKFSSTTLTGTTPFSGLAVGDFNGDGLPDVVTSFFSNLVVYLGKGGGAFGTQIVSRDPAADVPPVSLAAADLDGDGILDIVAVDESSVGTPHGIKIWKGKGDGTFQVTESFAVDANSVAVADFNLDGAPDIAVGGAATRTVTVLLNLGNGGFAQPTVYQLLDGVGTHVSIAAGDLNGDGQPDLVANSADGLTGSNDNLLAVMLGREDGSLGPPTYTVDHAATQDLPGPIALADLNGDGLLDVIVQNGPNYSLNRCSVSVLLGAGNGTLQPPVRYPCNRSEQVSAAGFSAGIVVTDFNGDGKPDVAAIFNYNYGYLQLFPGNGDGTLQSPAVYDVVNAYQPSSLAAANFNGDGRVDFAAGSGLGVSVMAATTGPFLRVSAVHSGQLVDDQTASYTFTVSNASGADATSGAISLAIFLPFGEYAPLVGDGWTCSAPATCTRSETLSPGSSYPPLTVSLNLEPAGQLPNLALAAADASGGGSLPVEALDIERVVFPPPTSFISVSGPGASDSPPSQYVNISQNDWVEIHGGNLVPPTTPASGVTWSNAPDFASGRMPTQLNGVRVTVDGKPAYIYFYCSALTDPDCADDQINILTPLDANSGMVTVGVTAPGISLSTLVNLVPITPALLQFGASGEAVATHLDYTLVGSVLLYPGLSTPARPGEQIVLWGVGFGLPVGPIVPGSSTQSGVLPSAVTCTLNGNPAPASIALVSPGLYQINFTVPFGTPDGIDWVACSYQGASTPTFSPVLWVQQ